RADRSVRLVRVADVLRGTHHDFGAPSCRSAQSRPARARPWAACAGRDGATFTAGVRPAQLGPAVIPPSGPAGSLWPPGARRPGATHQPRQSYAASRSHWAAPGTGTAFETPRAAPARPTRHRGTRCTRGAVAGGQTARLPR